MSVTTVYNSIRAFGSVFSNAVQMERTNRRLASRTHRSIGRN